MPDIEIFLKEKLNPLHKAYYALWVYWWPWWRGVYSQQNILQKWTRNNLVQEGQSFLDFGCGTGSFTLPAARLVTPKGRVYALDCSPRQLAIVQQRTKKAGLTNVETILSDSSKTNLPDDAIDVIWMCDVLHEIRERRQTLEELHRVLRREGILVIYDGMREKILNYTDGLFSLSNREGKLSRFTKIK